jgi:hypothetical protein
LLGILDDPLPLHSTPPKSRSVTDDEEGGPGSGEGDVHSTSVLEETDARVRVESSRSDAGEDDDVLFLTLKSVDRIKAAKKARTDQWLSVK